MTSLCIEAPRKRDCRQFCDDDFRRRIYPASIRNVSTHHLSISARERHVQMRATAGERAGKGDDLEPARQADRSLRTGEADARIFQAADRRQHNAGAQSAHAAQPFQAGTQILPRPQAE